MSLSNEIATKYGWGVAFKPQKPTLSPKLIFMMIAIAAFLNLPTDYLVFEKIFQSVRLPKLKPQKIYVY